MNKFLFVSLSSLVVSACGTSSKKESNSLYIKPASQNEAVDCTPNLFSGEFEVSQTAKSSSVSFPSSERDLNEPKEGKPLYHVELLRGSPVTLEQTDCSQFKVMALDHLKKDATEKKEFIVSLSLAKNEKISWTSNSVTIKGESGFPALLGFLGRRTYTVKLEKLANGNILVNEKVTGQALIPVPLPVTWKESYELILKK